MNQRTDGAQVTNSCPICDATAVREEKLIDALQTARYVLTAADGVSDDHLRVLRAKAAIDEALKLFSAPVR